jgi:hypothetical protein
VILLSTLLLLVVVVVALDALVVVEQVDLELMYLGIH